MMVKNRTVRIIWKVLLSKNSSRVENEELIFIEKIYGIGFLNT